MVTSLRMRTDNEQIVIVMLSHAASTPLFKDEVPGGLTPIENVLRVRHEISGSHRDRGGARVARHSTEAYREYVVGRVTQRTGVHRRSIVPVLSWRALRGQILARWLCGLRAYSHEGHEVEA